jgi:uncharacterized membrane protein
MFKLAYKIMAIKGTAIVVVTLTAIVLLPSLSGFAAYAQVQAQEQDLTQEEDLTQDREATQDKGQEESQESAATEQELFKISPLSYDLKITSLEALSLEYTLTNPFDTNLSFSLGLEEDERLRLQDNGLEIASVQGQDKLNLLDESVEVEVLAGQEKIIEIEVKPNQEKDYTQKIVIKLLQLESERNLESDEYSLEINVTSTMASQKQQFIKEAGAGAGLIAAIIVVAVAAQFLIKRKNNKKKKNNNGRKSN